MLFYPLQSKLISCSHCDRGYHTFCITPKIEDNEIDTWNCQFCNVTQSSDKDITQTPEITQTKTDEDQTDQEQPNQDQPTITKSPFSKRPGKRKKSQKFAHIKRSKYRAAKSSDNYTASTESEDSDANSLEEESVSSSPVKSSGFRCKKKCPTLNCDGLGHYTGKFDLHHTISGCPLYHNTTAEECKVSLVKFC